MKKIKKSTFILSILMPSIVFANYDKELMEKFGIDPSLIEQLETGNVLIGKNIFPVFINGESKGSQELIFLSDNNFYLNESIVSKLGLINNLEEDEENTFLDNYPGSKIVYEDATISIYVDKDYIKKETIDLEQKGFGLFSNYFLDYDKQLEREDGEEISDAFFANIDIGANYNGYLYRSNFTYNNFDDNFNVNYNYIQKNYLKDKRILKVGDISTLAPHYSNVELLGLQLSSYNSDISTVKARFTGNVRSQSRIEVYVNETIKIYETRVPSGYYEITDLFVPLSYSEITVVEKGDNGDFNERIEPIQAISFDLTDEIEYTITAGLANTKLINNNNDDSSLYDSWLVSGYSDIYKKGTMNAQSSILLADEYYFGGLGFINSNLETFLFDSTSIESGVTYNKQENDLFGYYAALSLNGYYMNRYSLNLYGRYESEDYSLLEFEDSNLEYQYSTSISIPMEIIDNISVNYNKSFYYDETENLDSVGVVITKTFKNESYLSVEGTYDSNDEWNISAILSIPIYSSDYHEYLDLSLFQNRNSTTYEASVNGEVNKYDYNIALSKNDDGTSAASINIDKEYKDVYMSTGAFATEQGVNNAFISLEGGLAYSDGNYDLTPDNISDTFGFIEISNFDNVEIETSSGTLKTSNGVAVIPSLNSNGLNEIVVDTRTLPKNSTLLNGYQEVNANYGDVINVKIDTQPFYNTLIKILNKNKEPLDQNYIIVDNEDNFITSVGLDGLIFFEQSLKQKIFKAKKGRFECVFNLDELIKEEGAIFENVICK